MAERLKENEMLVFMGTAALRAPDGSFLPAVKLYMKVDESRVDRETGLSAGEKELQTDIAALLAPKLKQYIDGMDEAYIEGN